MNPAWRVVSYNISLYLADYLMFIIVLKINSERNLFSMKINISDLCICTLLIIFSVSNVNAKENGGSRTNYSRNKHSSGHGGHYQGGSGSSHKGGTYKNARSNDGYGKHKN